MNPIYRTITQLDWITLILFLSLILLVVGKYFFRASFFNFVILPFNNKYITLNKKKGKLFQGFHLIMSVFQLSNMALFAFLAKSVLDENERFMYSELFPGIFMGLALFLLFKIVLQMANGYFFENQELMTELIFEKLSYFNYAGLVAFVGNILVIHIFPTSKSFIYGVILLLLIIICIGAAKILRNLQNVIVGNAFYFILYLCTLEISPIAIIISYLNS